MSNIEIVPAIIPESLGYIHDHVDRVKDFVHRVQIDVMDGGFAPTQSWPFRSRVQRSELQDLSDKKEKLLSGVEFEVDMMINDPQYFINDWMNVGASSLIIHVDSTKSLGEIINRARARGVAIGLAFKPSYGLGDIEEYLSSISSIQIMGNDKIGYNGVSLDEKVYEIARELREKYPHVTIGVDIGVNKETAPRLIEAGVNKLVSGSAIFSSEDVEGAVNYFKSLK